MEKAKSELKTNENMLVRTWLNKITPDNYAKMENELRKLLFGDRKTKDEEGFDKQEQNFEVDKTKLLIVVQTVFRKAQTEHAYSNFYAKLCSQI